MKQSTLVDILEAGIARSSMRSRANAATIALCLLATTACGFPRPPDVGGDTPADSGAPGDRDGPAGPVVAIHVSPSGDDSNDGLVLPVKTLKHAIGLAAANSQITTISLASGRYSASSGETFPYMVSSNLVIAGPAGGGAILVGNTTEPALLLRDASLQDLEFEGFGVVMDSMGATSLTNIRVRSSITAVRGRGGSSLVINNLDITGAASNCASGIILGDTADLKINGLVTRGLGTTLDIEDHSVSDLMNVNIAGDLGCVNSVIRITSDKTFSLSESLLDGGNVGIEVSSSTAGVSTQVTLKNVTLHNMNTAMALAHASVSMIGGELSHNTMANILISAINATMSLMGVTITQNPTAVMFAQSVSLAMRGCSVTANTGGIAINVVDPSTIDLGTATSPGANIFQGGSTGSVLAIEGADSGPLREVSAIGNTWNPSVQGADSTGRYDPALVIPGSSNGVFGPNYTLTGNMTSLKL